MTEGLTLYHQQAGEGAPVLLLHGFMGSSTEYVEAGGVARILAGRYRCIAVDLPGHGQSRSANPDDYSFPATAQKTLEVLNANGIERCGLYGYSMGGRLALYLLTQNPHRFRCAVLESAGPGLATETERAIRVASDLEWRRLLENGDMRRFLDRWYAQPVFADLSAEERSRVIARRRDNDPHGLAMSLEHLGTGVMPPLWDRLIDIDIPTLLLVGAQDRKFRTIADTMAVRMPQARVEVVSGAGHNVHAEQPDRVAAAIDTMMKTVT